MTIETKIATNNNNVDTANKAEVTTATDANEEIINCTEINVATSKVTNAPEVTRFQRGTTYRYYDTNTGEPLWYITIEKRTNTTVTVSGEKFKVFIQPHDRLLNYNKPTESFIRGNYRIDATDACEETPEEITPTTLQKFIEAKKEVSYWRNSNGARIWQIAYIRYGVNGGIVGQTPWLNHTMKEADRYLKDEYGMTLLEYLAAEDKWNDTDKGAILKDKIDRDCKPSVEPMPALFPAEDSDDDDELIDPPEIESTDNIFIGQDGTNYIIRAKNINITIEDRKIRINGHAVAKYKTDAGVQNALKYVTDWRNNIANYKIFDINDWNTVFDDFDFAGGNEDKFVYIDDEPPITDKVITPDEMLALVDTLDTVNAAAPYGWQISYDGKNFPIEFNGKIVATLDSLALTKVLPPDKFFEQFNPNVPPKELYINERRKELDMLLDFRKFVEDDADRLKTLANLIEDVKREILNAELDTEHPPDFAE